MHVALFEMCSNLRARYEYTLNRFSTSHCLFKQDLLDNITSIVYQINYITITVIQVLHRVPTLCPMTAHQENICFIKSIKPMFNINNE